MLMRQLFVHRSQVTSRGRAPEHVVTTSASTACGLCPLRHCCTYMSSYGHDPTGRVDGSARAAYVL